MGPYGKKLSVFQNSSDAERVRGFGSENNGRPARTAGLPPNLTRGEKGKTLLVRPGSSCSRDSFRRQRHETGAVLVLDLHQHRLLAAGLGAVDR